MSDVLRPYRDLFPQIGQRVMIDDSSVVIGDVRLADDVGIWPLVVIRGDVRSEEHTSELPVTSRSRMPSSA